MIYPLSSGTVSSSRKISKNEQFLAPQYLGEMPGISDMHLQIWLT